MAKTIEIIGLHEALKSLDIFEGKVRKEAIFNSTRAAMTPYVAQVKQAVMTDITTLNTRARRQMSSSIGIKSAKIGKRKKAIAWSIVGPVLGREFTKSRKRVAGSSGRFDYGKMSGWFGGQKGVKPHVTGNAGAKRHPGIEATPTWVPTFERNTNSILSRLKERLRVELIKAIKAGEKQSKKRMARQAKALEKVINEAK